MQTSLRYDPAAYRAQVAHIAEQVVANDAALPTVGHRVDFEINSYHGAAIKRAEQDRFDRLYPRLYR